AFVEELARCGLRHVCICPGSRSSPLAIAFARDARIKKWLHLDERSASFFALGMARYLGQPVAVVCSSGTAAANFHPAVAESHNDAVPLLLLTADRPPEMVGWGALQTMEQEGLYGIQAKWSVTLPPPEASPGLMAYVRSVAGRAYATAQSSPAGPVHINLPFREPLEPVPVPSDFSQEDAPSQAWEGREAASPYLATPPVQRRLASPEVERLANELASRELGLIICGPQQDPSLAGSVTALARRLGYPILADVLSQVRCGPHDRSLVLDGYDAFLRDAALASSLAPEVVVRFGGVPVSKPLTQYLERHPRARHLLVDDGPGWRDPSFLTSEALHVDPVSLCHDLAAHLQGRAPREAWSQRWLSLDQSTTEAMARRLAGFGEMFEGKVFSELAQMLPEGAIVFAGNSMPVRDLDTFFPSSGRGVRFLANRGVSGIDGVVSSALGAAAASGRRVVLALGDISFYHDMNGLLAARAHKLDATIIVLNNNGGGIFSFLPQAAYPEVFETYFGTPHGLTFRAAAELYGLGYALTPDWGSFHEAVAGSLAGGGVTVIEVPAPERATNVALHQQVWQAVASAIQAPAGR
ncbi:MAG: 2-succinyl-5-enolpyruvyl-6-hydroxy-3-cyclohexene-1-carboxylic-acid synthase, partial [Chloroflexi bacterium]|nr:2-succinyl-5-enolpyruvyl-6-hydroxy-3-cyclohexene-1-carboxylic-acid synthase [Chloroflexota bacterium]